VIDVRRSAGRIDALVMYDRNDRSRGQADGNVKGATKGGSDVHGIDSAVDRSCPVRRLAASETLCARRMRGEDLGARARELHGPPSASLRRRIAAVGRFTSFTSCTNLTYRVGGSRLEAVRSRRSQARSSLT
jgi:hypothetical protein